MSDKKEKTQKQFPSRAAEELYWAGKQFVKTLMIAICLAIVLFLTHFFSSLLTVLLFFIGFILLLATITYTIGHLVRYFYFSNKKA